MRQSATLLLQKHDHGPRISLLLLALMTVLTTSHPAIAQKETPDQTAVHTAAYNKAEAPAVKREPDGATIPIKVTPNPSMGSFRVSMYGSKEESVRIEIRNQYGRIMDARVVSAQTELRFGYWYQPGTYYLHIIQGTNRRKVKLVKLLD